MVFAISHTVSDIAASGIDCRKATIIGCSTLVGKGDAMSIRRFALLLVLGILVAGTVHAQTWQDIDPISAGWSAERLEAARLHSKALGPTALMIVQDGRVVARWGDTSRKVNMASVRKSLLSALYGSAVAEGRVNLSARLSELGIDDNTPSLTAEEKTATIRDLLMSRSGIYHPAAHETADIKRKRPIRGSHSPGTFWFYNNWDFNVLGTIYRQQTGEDIFMSFANRIAGPIGMEDFSVKDGRYDLEKLSEHPAYPIRLSARDAARFGQLFLNDGRWGAKQIIPASWVRESTTAYSWAKRIRQGYGYMWWTLPEDTWGPNAFYASGYGGQIIAVVPSKRLVAVQTVDLNQNPKGVRTSAFVDLLKEIAVASP
ncbi:beta-lactamase family protein [Rhizobium pusense]|nr:MULTISPECIES: serine hydrolase [Rhizobium/Agrobacterium group]MDH0912511.1 beta-lactamase family protein [Agrobacterium pusense]MDH1098872.1 beta-lactamase family protein [Agrobacterium pusense]MDH1115157.1 beta-lactamase family protein [Agrobacterium pusense]MDH2196963.1 beta-lactamase family protein [Agrobacterium pusense]